MSRYHELMQQDYDPCAHGALAQCWACDMARLEAQAEQDDAEIVQLQGLLVQVVRAKGALVPEAIRYLAARGLL